MSIRHSSYYCRTSSSSIKSNQSIPHSEDENFINDEPEYVEASTEKSSSSNQYLESDDQDSE